MDFQHYLTFVSALVFVVTLIFLLAWIARRVGLGGVGTPTGGRRRLALVETLPIDAKRRVVIIRRDEVEHLLLLGPDTDTVIETGIGGPSFRAVVEGCRDADETAVTG